MGFIYKITNDINNKVYIGKTQKTVEERWNWHLRDYKYEYYNGKIYRAMRKYGPEHFHIETIEECPDDQLSQKEIYWIGRYNSYEKGYNSTLGGEGVTKYNYEEVLQLWNEGYPIKFIAQKLGAHPDIIGQIIRIQGVTKEEIYHRGAGNNRKIIGQYDKQGNLIAIFPSGSEAARQTGNAQANISKCCLGKTKSCGGYIWKYIDDQFTKEEKYEILKQYQQKGFDLN